MRMLSMLIRRSFFEEEILRDQDRRHDTRRDDENQWIRGEFHPEKAAKIIRSRMIATTGITGLAANSFLRWRSSPQ